MESLASNSSIDVLYSFIGPISVPDSCTSIDISGKLATGIVKSLEEGSRQGFRNQRISSLDESRYLHHPMKQTNIRIYKPEDRAQVSLDSSSVVPKIQARS